MFSGFIERILILLFDGIEVKDLENGLCFFGFAVLKFFYLILIFFRVGVDMFNIFEWYDCVLMCRFVMMFELVVEFVIVSGSFDVVEIVLCLGVFINRVVMDNDMLFVF